MPRGSAAPPQPGLVSSSQPSQTTIATRRKGSNPMFDRSGIGAPKGSQTTPPSLSATFDASIVRRWPPPNGADWGERPTRLTRCLAQAVR